MSITTHTAASSFVDALPPRFAEPVRRPVMTQFWADLVFLHWRYDVDVVQRLLPPGVLVDAHDGSAWVALVPFRMERLGLPGVGPLPLVSQVPEVNVRTYVRSGAGRRRGRRTTRRADLPNGRRCGR